MHKCWNFYFTIKIKSSLIVSFYRLIICFFSASFDIQIHTDIYVIAIAWSIRVDCVIYSKLLSSLESVINEPTNMESIFNDLVDTLKNIYIYYTFESEYESERTREWSRGSKNYTSTYISRHMLRLICNLIERVWHLIMYKMETL